VTDDSGGPAYEFDVAVSFADEDRELVEEIVSQLKDAGLRVFYDDDYRADSWGEDLIEYLDNIYRVQARYTIMFVSHSYAEKMWTRHERRSALARAIEQKSAYILPVRMDSTELAGLRPTIGYLDARRMGVDGIVSATLVKLAGHPPAPAASISRVPRTEAERQQVLLARPPAWEFLYFAGQLLYERNSIEHKYRDHEIQYAPATGEIVEKYDIRTYINRRFNDAMRIASKMSGVVNNTAAQERAFGAPGQPGDPQRLAHLAKRWNSAYEEFMDWAARVRAVSAPAEFQNLLELLARYADPPVEQYRQFVDDYIARADAIPAAIAAGEKVQIELSLHVRVPDEVTQPYLAELDRVKGQLGSSSPTVRRHGLADGAAGSTQPLI
jgi:TIR domain